MNRLTGLLATALLITTTSLPCTGAPQDVIIASPLRTLGDKTDEIDGLAFSPDGRSLASGSRYKSVKMWDIRTGEIIRIVGNKENGGSAVAFSPDGQVLAVVDYKGVKLFNAQTGIERRVLSGSIGWNYSVAFSPDGRIVAGGSGQESVGTFVDLWDASTGELLHILGGHTNSIWSVAFSPDAKTLASGSSDKTIRLWDVDSGNLLRTIPCDEYNVWSVAFSPDGKTIASAGSKALKLWNVTDGSLLRTISRPDDDSFCSVAFSPDGKILASGQSLSKGTVMLWDVASGGLLQTLVGHSDYVKSVAFSSDGRTLASSSDDKSIKLWAIAPYSPEIMAKQPVTRPVEQIQTTLTTATSTKRVTSNAPVKDKWALIVGISNFQNREYNLKYAAKDAQDFYNFLVNEANFQRDHVLLLLDEKATRRNIMNAFGDQFLPSVTQEGDLVVVFVSTHGTPARKDKGGRNFIVAHDTNRNELYATGVDMDELYRRIKEGVKTDRALIVMDTCYSGGGVPGAKGPESMANFDANDMAVGCGHLVISSSSPTERSWESSVTKNGVFTKYLLAALRSNNAKTDVKSAFADVLKKVSWEVRSAYGEKQTPQLGGEWEGKQLLLSVPATEPRQNYQNDAIIGSVAINSNKGPRIQDEIGKA